MQRVKFLLLLRHAKSSWADPELEDHDRPLAERGVRDARRLAKFFGRESPPLDLVLCSSALRARQTLAHLEPKFPREVRTRVMRSLYLPSVEGLLRVLRGVPASVSSVMVVGHSPSLEALALVLASGAPPLANVLAEKFPTGSLCVVALPIADFSKLRPECGELRSVVTPRSLRSEASSERAPNRGHTLELGEKAGVLEAARAAVAAASEQIRANVEGARLGQDPEFSHQLRVGLRRLRATLRFFRRRLDGPATAALGREVTWCFRQLGPLRHHEVFVERVVTPLRGHKPIAGLWSALERARAERLEEVRALLSSARFDALLSSLLSYQAALEARQDKGAERLRDFARKRLSRRLRKVLALESAVHTHAASDVRKLEKELKKLHETVAIVGSVFPERRVRRYWARLRKLQRVLGALHDVATAERILRSSRLAARERAQRTAQSLVRSHLDGLAVRGEVELGPAFVAFAKAQPFWA